MKHILLIATGGTIASKSTENGLAPQISSEEMLDYVPAAREFCTIDAIQILNIDVLCLNNGALTRRFALSKV